MAGEASSNTVFLYVLRLLMEQSDAEHPITADSIIKYLAECGYSRDRKAIYRYIDAMREFGIEVESAGRRGYYVISRTFEIHELKLLADAVQSSRFITVKKSRELIEKLGTLASVNEAKQLNRSIHLVGSNKTDNERIFYTLDAVYEAISNNKRVKFKYFRYLPDGSKEYRHNGAEYSASPYSVVWDNDNYYMQAYYEKYGGISSFRLDLMEDVRVSRQPRQKEEVYGGYNPNEREKAAFSQFGGEPSMVICEFQNELAGPVFDHFGADIKTSPVGKDKFRVTLNVIVSAPFFSWMFSFGDRARIVAPQSVVAQMKEQLDSVKNLYNA